MKKAYSKPQIFFDSFELSQSIAAGCEYISNQGWNECSIFINQIVGTIFQVKGVCETTPPNPDDYVCYHNPDDSRSVFTS